MFLWALLFLLIAIVTALVGFSGVAIAVSLLSKILFFISIVSFIVFLVLIFVEKYQMRERK